MYIDTSGEVELAKKILRKYRGRKTLPEIVLCPGFLSICEIKKILRRGKIKLGAQDAFWADGGAHTGAVSPKTLKGAGCDYVIIGHSERRDEIGETDEMIAKKVKAVIGAGLKVILCVGENLADRKNRKTETVIESQIRGALVGLNGNFKNLFIAYEPVWALSSKGNDSADVKDVLETILFVRKVVVDMSRDNGKDVPLLYGGSVRSENAHLFLGEDNIDGVLVGGASVKLNQLCGIIDSAMKTMRI
jgi:triosephosphate isomerase